MSKLKVNYENNENAKAKYSISAALKDFLERIERTSKLSKDWLRTLAYNQIVDLKFCKELKRNDDDKTMSCMEIMDKAVNLWYKLPEYQKQYYRQPDLMEPHTLQMKLQQNKFQIHLNKNEKLLNLYTWFVAEYFTQHENFPLEENMIKASEKFESILGNFEFLIMKHFDETHKNDQSVPLTMEIIYQNIHDHVTTYTNILYGQSYQNFYIGYKKLREGLSETEATRHALCFWSLLPQEIKSRFTNEYDLTASPSRYTLDDHMNWVDGGLHIGIKSINYCQDLFCNGDDANIIDITNHILPTSYELGFTFKQFFEVKRACIKWLKNIKEINK